MTTIDDKIAGYLAKADGTTTLGKQYAGLAMDLIVARYIEEGNDL